MGLEINSSLEIRAGGGAGITPTSATVTAASPSGTIVTQLMTSVSGAALSVTSGPFSIDAQNRLVTSAVTGAADTTAKARVKATRADPYLAIEQDIVVTAVASGVAPLPQLTLSGPLAFNATDPADTLVANIGNVPAGVTPTLSPNDGRFAIAGNGTDGWTVRKGAGASSAGTIALSVAAAGATSVTADVVVSSGPTMVWRNASAGGLAMPMSSMTLTGQAVEEVRIRVARADITVIRHGFYGCYKNTLTAHVLQDMTHGRIVDIGYDVGVQRLYQYPIGSADQPALFGGNATGTIPNGAGNGTVPVYLHDAKTLAVKIPKGAAYLEKTVMNPALANVAVPIVLNTLGANAVINQTDGEAMRVNATRTAGWPATTGADDFNGRRGLGGFSIAQVPSTQRSVLLIGDSRDGQGKELPINMGLAGPTARSVGAKYPVINGSIGGDWIQANAYNCAMHKAAADYVDTVAIRMGINDILGKSSTWLQIKPYLYTLINQFPGKRIVLLTPEPAPTADASGTAGTDLTKQTVAASDPQRVAMNTALRGNIDGVPFFEIAGLYEPTLNAGKIRTDLGNLIYETTGSMLHSNHDGSVAISALIDADALVATAAVVTMPAPSFDLVLTNPTFAAAMTTNGLSGGYGIVYGAMPPTLGMTIELWVKGSVPGSTTILDNGVARILTNSTGKLEVRISGTVVMTQSSNTDLGNGAWHCIRLSLHHNNVGSGNQVLLLNGAVEATSNVQIASAANFAQHIGVRTNSTSPAVSYTGMVDEIAIFAEARPDPYTPTPFSNSDPKLWMGWHLNDNGAVVKGAAYLAKVA